MLGNFRKNFAGKKPSWLFSHGGHITINYNWLLVSIATTVVRFKLCSPSLYLPLPLIICLSSLFLPKFILHFSLIICLSLTFSPLLHLSIFLYHLPLSIYHSISLSVSVHFFSLTISFTFSVFPLSHSLSLRLYLFLSLTLTWFPHHTTNLSLVLFLYHLLLYSPIFLILSSSRRVHIILLSLFIYLSFQVEFHPTRKTLTKRMVSVPKS